MCCIAQGNHVQTNFIREIGVDIINPFVLQRYQEETEYPSNNINLFQIVVKNFGLVNICIRSELIPLHIHNLLQF